MLKVAKTGRTFCVSQGYQLAWGTSTGLSLRAAAGRVAIPASGLNGASFNVKKGAHQQWPLFIIVESAVELENFSSSSSNCCSQVVWFVVDVSVRVSCLRRITCSPSLQSFISWLIFLRTLADDFTRTCIYLYLRKATAS